MTRKVIFYTIFISFLLSMICLVELDFYYIDNRPTVPDVATGRTYPIVAHGPPVYVSKKELFLLRGLIGSTVSLFIVGAYLQERWKLSTRR
jgi:hypothetical protein